MTQVTVPITPSNRVPPKAYVDQIIGGVPALQLTQPEASTVTAGYPAADSRKTKVHTHHVDGRLIQQEQITLNTADILTMYTAGINILTAPQLYAGQDQTIWVFGFAFELLYPTSGGVAYTGGGTVTLEYTGQTTAITSTVAAAAVTGTANSYYYAPAIAYKAYTNTGISITNGSALFAAGNSNALVTVWFAVY